MTNITPKIIANLKLEVNQKRDIMMASKKNDKEEQTFQLIHNYWLDCKEDRFNSHLASCVNTMKGSRNMSGASNALAKRIVLPRELKDSILNTTQAMFYVEVAKKQLAKTLLQLLVERDKLEHEWKESLYKTATGKEVKTITAWMEFQEENKSLVGDNKLPRGMHLEPGVLISKGPKVNDWEQARKYGKSEKEYLRTKSSSAWMLIKKDAEWWTNYFEQSKWYTQALNNGIEDSINLDVRVKKYVEVIQHINTLDRFYLSWWLDARGRSYLDLQFAGIKIHGDSVEKHIMQSANPITITKRMIEEAQSACGHIYHGDMDESMKTSRKINDDKALTLWNKQSATIKDCLMTSESCTPGGKSYDMGEILYHEGLIEIATSKVGDTTHRLIGKDLSTNGFAIVGSTLSDPMIMKPCNTGGHKNVYYAHGVMAECFSLTIKQVKDHVSTALFHGSGSKAISQVLTTKLGRTFSPAEVNSALHDSFGPNVTIMSKMAKWTSHLFTNINTSLKMISPDGNTYLSQGYTTQNKLEIEGLSFNTKNYRSKVQIISDMPILFSNDRKKVINVLLPATKKSKGGEIKMSGGEANITHMLDAFMVRLSYLDACCDMYDIHDNFFPQDNDFDSLLTPLQKAHHLFIDYNYYELNMVYMAKHRVDKSKIVMPLPVFHYGNKEKAHKAIDNSFNFLQQ